jgi:hypothetical protein
MHACSEKENALAFGHSGRDFSQLVHRSMEKGLKGRRERGHVSVLAQAEAEFPSKSAARAGGFTPR